MSYQLPDEPHPGVMGHLVVNPFWPFLAFMGAGAWLAWPWMVFNSFAIGSPRKWRDLALAVVGLAVTGGLLAALVAAHGAGLLPDARSQKLAFLALVGWRLLVTYALHVSQVGPHALHEHFGGVVRSGAFLAVAAFVIGGRVEGVMPPWLRLLVA